MKLSILKDFLKEVISVNKFKKIITFEVDKFINASKKKGSSVSIYVEQDEELFIGKSEAVLLLKLYKKGNLSEHFISYIVDGLLLSEKVEFESEEFIESFETLTDPSVNGPLSISRVEELLKLFTE